MNLCEDCLGLVADWNAARCSSCAEKMIKGIVNVDKLANAVDAEACLSKTLDRAADDWDQLVSLARRAAALEAENKRLREALEDCCWTNGKCRHQVKEERSAFNNDSANSSNP